MLFILSSFQARQELAARAVLSTSVFWQSFTIILFVSGIFLCIFCLLLLIRPALTVIFGILETRIARIGKGYAKILIGLVSGFYVLFYLLNKSFPEFLLGFYPHLLLLSACSFLIIILLKNLLNKDLFTKNLIAIFVLIPVLLLIGERAVMDISYINNTPFSNSWAESSHLYFSSVVYGKKIYGYSLPMYPYNQTRYLMQSLPFIFSNLPIWIHRAWQFMLDNIILLVFIFFLQKRLEGKEKTTKLLFFAFSFLWLSQIYIYYHLIVIALLVIAFYSNQDWKRNLLIIVIASFWAGFSRVNWIPVPGLLAAFLYLLETKYEKGILKYLQRPFFYALVGGVIGIIAQLIYISISGNNSVNTHTAIFRSLLLWYRLLPNPTFTPGILPGILLISGFLIFFVIKYYFGKPEIYWLRKVLIAVLLLTFFIGGLVVSIKIGGGNNLHNMDAFSVFILVLVAYIYLHQVRFDEGKKPIKVNRFSSLILLGIMITPILWSLTFPVHPNETEINASDAQDVIGRMNEIIDTYAPNREVLFISQRQLVTFGYLKNIKMIPGYEQELLMETAMSQDRGRLDPFLKDLTNHKYEVIISYPLHTIAFGYEMPYAEENNLWVSWVSSQIYLRYNTIALFPDYGIEMLIPK